MMNTLGGNRNRGDQVEGGTGELKDKSQKWPSRKNRET